MGGICHSTEWIVPCCVWGLRSCRPVSVHAGRLVLAHQCSVEASLSIFGNYVYNLLYSSQSTWLQCQQACNRARKPVNQSAVQAVCQLSSLDRHPLCWPLVDTKPVFLQAHLFRFFGEKHVNHPFIQPVSELARQKFGQSTQPVPELWLSWWTSNPQLHADILWVHFCREAQ